jgi:hypothetical protein
MLQSKMLHLERFPEFDRPNKPVAPTIKIMRLRRHLDSDLVEYCQDIFLLCWIYAHSTHAPRGIVLYQG